MNFSDNLKSHRMQLGLSNKEFANKIGINYHTYIGYEAGRREPNYKTLCQIAETLQISTDQLLGYGPTDIERTVSFLRQQGWDIVKNEPDGNPDHDMLVDMGEITSEMYFYNPFPEDLSNQMLPFSKEELLRFIKEVKSEIDHVINYYYLIETSFTEYDSNYTDPESWANFIFSENHGKNIAAHLKQIRQKRQLTKEQFAQNLQIDSETYMSFENPNPFCEPDYMAAEEIASKLSLTLDDLEKPCKLSFADILKNKRKQQRLTAAKLAKAIGVNTNTYMGYENTGREPSFSLLCSIAGVLGCSTDELLGHEAFAINSAIQFLQKFDYIVNKTEETKYEVSSAYASDEEVAHGPYEPEIFLKIVEHIQNLVNRYVNKKEIVDDLFWQIYHPTP